VHINDALPVLGDDLVYESRYRRAVPGAGIFELVEFAGVLAELRYDGIISLEVLSADLRSRPPGEGARELLDSLTAVWPVEAVRRVV
jgi:sugar phosphate isomerase/epimerase